MAKKLYIGNLPYTATDEQLREMFSKAGEVEEAAVLMDRVTGRSRGFGFVTMAADEGAASAVEMFNGTEMDGRKLVVNEARPMTPRRESGGGGFNRGGGRGFGGGRDY